jgi:hypothetical protein
MVINRPDQTEGTDKVERGCDIWRQNPGISLTELRKTTRNLSHVADSLENISDLIFFNVLIPSVNYMYQVL